MISIFASMFQTASGQPTWDAPPHWRRSSRQIAPADSRRIDRETTGLRFKAP